MVAWLIVGMANLKGKTSACVCVCVCIIRNPRRERACPFHLWYMVNNSSPFSLNFYVKAKIFRKNCCLS